MTIRLRTDYRRLVYDFTTIRLGFDCVTDFLGTTATVFWDHLVTLRHDDYMTTVRLHVLRNFGITVGYD